jgi:hypothetical protein
MAVMRRRWLLLGCAGAVWLGACGAEDAPPLSAACTDRAQVQRALAAAPDPVVLADGTRVSTCIRDATTQADLENLGGTLTAVAAELGREPGREAQLGYLIGAVRRGLQRTSGVGAELARRLERAGSGAADTVTLQRGVRAGEATG